ncbi:hypothetical protein [Zhongshania sp. BJYM1]|jgi:hypothetical protein|uniref:hypothetical protein n=1 Tax=Zhongshania aquatica TaxID=2965069 RepID=UPI0022B50AC0|nr:hypothetical protein [Marortus sp. BJYM1]
MKESFRGQCNLHVYFAEQYFAQINDMDADQWGGHFKRATTESMIWQLMLAYQSHLADLVDQQPKFGLPIPQGVFYAQSFAALELPPEIDELADREAQPGWLNSLVNYPFLQTAVASSAGLIASDAASVGRVDLDLEECLAELKSLIARHRATLMEY